MAFLQITETVSAYEQSMIKVPEQFQAADAQPENPSDRYYLWELPTIINNLGLNYEDSTTTWLGVDPQSHIYSLLFCLLKGCLSDPSGSSNFTRLKFGMYKLGKKYLPIHEQRALVQALSIAQYTTDLCKFLSKCKKLQSIFVTIFKQDGRSRARAAKGEAVETEVDKRLDQVQSFCSHFQFCRFSPISQNSAALLIATRLFYIVQHRTCFFVLESNSNPSQQTKPKKLALNKKNQLYTSSRKKLQYSTPKFILRSNVMASSDRNDSANNFNSPPKNNSSERVDKRDRVNSPDQTIIQASFNSPPKRNSPSRVKTFDASEDSFGWSNKKRTEKQLLKGISSVEVIPQMRNSQAMIKPKSSQISPKMNLRSGFVYRSLGADSRGEMEEIRSKIAINILERNRKTTSTTNFSPSCGHLSPESHNPERTQYIRPSKEVFPVCQKITFTYSSRADFNRSLTNIY